LVEALKAKIVRGAGLDVFEVRTAVETKHLVCLLAQVLTSNRVPPQREPKVHPDLLTFPSVTLLPHIGTATIEARSDMFVRHMTSRQAQCALTPVRLLMTTRRSSTWVGLGTEQLLQLENVTAVLEGRRPRTPVNDVGRQ
jgi:hypothetical protein